MKISVIIPNYNNQEYIIKCLTSVASQTMKDFEIIVIDDGSTDDSVNKVKEFINDNNVNITLIEQYNQNASIARNKGIEIAKGDYLYFIDSDDELYDNMVFERICSDINDCDLLIGNYNRINEKDEIILEYDVKKDDLIDIDSKYRYSLISPVPSNKLYKRETVINNNLYFSNVRIAQDLNFYLKYLSACEKIKVVDYKMYKYRILQTSMSRKISFNIFDIYNSFLEVKNYYKRNNKIDDYNKYIAIAELIHYNIQMEKIINIKTRREKKFIYNFFYYHIGNIDMEKIYKESNYKRIKKKTLLKKYLKYIYLSKSYPKIKAMLKKKK